MYMSTGSHDHLYTLRYEHTNMYKMKRSYVAAGAGMYMPGLKVHTHIHTHASTQGHGSL